MGKSFIRMHRRPLVVMESQILKYKPLESVPRQRRVCAVGIQGQVTGVVTWSSFMLSNSPCPVPSGLVPEVCRRGLKDQRHPWGGEKAQAVIALAALLKDLGSIPSTHIVAHSHL